MAAMMTLSLMKTPKLIENIHKRLKRSFHAMTADDIQSEFKWLQPNNEPLQWQCFSDDHFRTGYEGFVGSYTTLYDNMLLSYSLFCEMVDEKKRTEIRGLFQNIKEDTNKDKLVSLLSALINDISEKKNLNKRFIAHRLFEELLPHLLDVK